MIKENKDFNKKEYFEMCIHNDEYDCPNCGVVEDFVDVSIKGHDVEGKYCLVCLAKWYKGNLPLLTKRRSK